MPSSVTRLFSLDVPSTINNVDISYKGYLAEKQQHIFRLRNKSAKVIKLLYIRAFHNNNDLESELAGIIEWEILDLNSRTAANKHSKYMTESHQF